MAPRPVSPGEERRRRLVGVNAETVTDVTSTDFPGHYAGEDHSWSLEKFASKLQIQFHKNAPHEASFSIIQVDAAIANAFRRILIDEIPTLAIETVYVSNNTSIVQDEVLAARLGLVPLTGSVKGINWLRYEKKPVASLDDDFGGPGGDEVDRDMNDSNTVILKLQKECTWNPDRKSDDTDPNKLYINSNVYASDIQFEPASTRQAEQFSEEAGGVVKAVNPGILLAKMRPGQVLDLQMHAIKGIGADHAKFSPVATATYRLMPTIDILKPIVGDEAMKFARCFPKGVIGLDEVTREESESGESAFEGRQGAKKAVVRNSMRDTVSRECLRHPEFKGKVKLGRLRDHFIFNVESTGQFESDVLFQESVKILRAKCLVLRHHLREMVR